MNKTPPLIAPARNAGFSRSRNRTRYSAVNPAATTRALNTRTLSLLSQDRHSPLHSGGIHCQQMADTCRDTVVLLEKTSPG
ncbi:hypothetical protein ECZU24_59410 [Escherichia coli]|nr:hypothetical protein ECZU24_59410 [Escherichia coli]